MWGSTSFCPIVSAQSSDRELALGHQLHQKNTGAQERAITCTGAPLSKGNGERPRPPLGSLILSRNPLKVTLDRGDSSKDSILEGYCVS